MKTFGTRIGLVALLAVLGAGLLLSNQGVSDARNNVGIGSGLGDWRGEYVIRELEPERAGSAEQWDCLQNSKTGLCSISPE